MDDNCNDSNNNVDSSSQPGDDDMGGNGRRVTIGGANNNNNTSSSRRGSLGMDMINEALFGRRPSGFADLEGFGRRGSMDSTVLDAAIMDLTRRRLSMAMGGGMPSDNFGSLNDPLSSMGGMGGMSSMAGMMNPMGVAGMNNMNHAPSPATASNAVTNLNVRQQQLQEQQREIERKQKELELQRQQILAAMEERRRVMQQMQSKIQGSEQGGTSQAAVAQRNSLLGSLGGGLGGGMGAGFGGGGMGLGGMGAGFGGSGFMGNFGSGGPAVASSSGSMGQSGGSSDQQWYVCKICNSKAFSNREEAFAHESICMQSTFGASFRRESGMHDARRGSLDLLGALAGAAPTVATSSNRLSQGELQANADVGGASNLDSQRSMSDGPFTLMESALPLAMEPDKDWLTPLHCFVRRHCVEVFTATEDDVATPSKGKRKPIHVGQVGIRCPHCHTDESSKSRERGSVYYPTTIASIYNATMNLLQRHLHNCTAVPQDIMRRYETLKADDARSGTSKKYWVESALSLGLVDTPNGIRFSALPPPPLPSLTSQQRSTGNFNGQGNDDDFFNSNSNALTILSHQGNQDETPVVDGSLNQDNTMDGSNETSKSVKLAEGSIAAVAASAKQGADNNIPDTEFSLTSSAPLVTPEDEPYATAFSFHLLSQMQPCVFTEADRLGKRKGLPPGFPGLACRHCFGGYGSGRFFPSSIKTLSDTSKTLNVLHNHMMRCRKCPAEVRDTLDNLRKSHDEQRAKMKFGSQKAFFARIWDRLHYKDPNVNSKRKFQQPSSNSYSSSGGGAAAVAASGASPPGVSGNFSTPGNFQQVGGGFMGGMGGAGGFPGGLAGLGFQSGITGGFPGGFPGGFSIGYGGSEMMDSNKRRKLQEMANSHSSN